MRYNKVLLVCPKFLKGRNRLAHFPLVGIGYVAEALNKAGITVSVLDMNLGYEFCDLKDKIDQFKPDLVGFTAMTLGYKEFYGMVGEVKRLYPELKILLGGAHLSAVREQVFHDCPDIDYGIILEGDISIVQLCQGEDFNRIQGFVYRNNGKIITKQFGSFIENLDGLSFPKYESFELDKYLLKQISIVTSRGCPYDCIYCSVNASIGKKFRARSAQSIVEEIEYWYNRGYRQIFILDDNFTLLRKRVEDFCGLLAKKNFKDLRLKITSGIRADKTDRELLIALREIGVDYIAFGVEAASNKVLKSIKKGEDIEVIENGIKVACELGFTVDLFFLLGSPGETMEDIKLSFNLARRYPVRRAIFYNLIPFPSTELLSWLKEKDYLIKPLDEILNNASYYKNQPCFYTPELSIKDRIEAFKMGQKVYIDVRSRFIEKRIKGPVFFKRIFSRLYALPATEDLINNNSLVLRAKEVIKKAFLNS